MAIHYSLSHSYSRLVRREGGLSDLAEILEGKVVISDKLNAIEAALDGGVIDQHELLHATSRPLPEDFGLESSQKPTIIPKFFASDAIGIVFTGTAFGACYLLTFIYIVLVEGGGWGIAIIVSMPLAALTCLLGGFGSMVLVGSIDYILPKAAAYRRFRNVTSRHDTLEAARSIYAKATDIQTFYSVSGAEFERLVARVFRRWGFHVEEVGGSNDGGIDLVIKRGQDKALVQCKALAKPVGPAIVRELYGTLIHSDASHAFLATIEGATKSSSAWISDKPITILIADDFLRDHPPSYAGN